MQKAGSQRPPPKTRQSGKSQDWTIHIPAEVRDSGTLNRCSSGELRVYFELRSRANARGMTRTTLKTLAYFSGITTRNGIDKIVVSLEAKGLITKRFKPRGYDKILGKDWPKNTWIFYT